MAEGVKRINVTLPTEQVERIQRLVQGDDPAARSVSAFVAEAVADRLAREEAHTTLVAVLRELAGEPSEDDRSWAAAALDLAEQVANEHRHADRGAA